MPAEVLAFRPGNVLATAFTGTLSERLGTAVERIPTPQRLADWLEANGLAVGSCTDDQLELAYELREAIHVAGTAAATEDALPPSTVQVLNDSSARGGAAARLTPDGDRTWQLGPDSPVEDALGVIAADAISLVAGEKDGRLALCASPTCRAVFLDTSQSRSRRWCDMNSCGNREKKARLKARQRGLAGASG